MKKIITLVLSSVVAYAQAQTADEVINKYLDAVGGKAKLQAISSLEYTQSSTLNSPVGEIPVTATFIKVKNKLFRLNTSSEILGSGFSLVTDTAGWVYIAASPMFGSEANLQKLKPEELKPLKSQMACEGYFPELVNYAAKGYTAELAGEAKVSGRPSYRVKLKKEKEEWTFLIDKQNGLVNSMTVKGAAATAMTGIGAGKGQGKADKFELTLEYSAYQEVNGIKFPGKIKLQLPIGIVNVSITGVKVNAPVDARWYKPR